MKNVIEGNPESQQKSNCEEHFCEWPILNNWSEKIDQNKFPNGNPLQYSCLETPMEGGTLVSSSPWGCYEFDTTERFPFHFSLSCIGEGNGNPLQCSCLEKPRDGGAWWADVYGVAQSRTWQKRLSSKETVMMELVN